MYAQKYPGMVQEQQHLVNQTGHTTHTNSNGTIQGGNTNDMV